MKSSDSFLSPYEVPAMYGRALTEMNCTEDLLKVHNPTFDMYKNDLWRKRKKQLARLTFLTGQWITRRRVERRLMAIKAKVEGMDKSEVRPVAVSLSGDLLSSITNLVLHSSLSLRLWSSLSSTFSSPRMPRGR